MSNKQKNLPKKVEEELVGTSTEFIYYISRQYTLGKTPNQLVAICKYFKETGKLL